MRDDEKFEIIRALDLLPHIAGASWAMLWFRINEVKNPTKEEFREKTVEYFSKIQPLLKSFEDIQKCIEIYDSNRFLNHFPKVEIIKGDAIKTIPKYIKNNPSLVVSLLYLDFLLYEPTKIAIEKFVPKMPKGSLLVFNLIGEKNWPGPTKALLDNLNIKKLKFKKFSFDPYVHYAVIE